MPRASVTIAGRAAVISSFPSRRRSVRLVAASARPFRGRMDTTTGPFRFGCGASGRTAVARARSRRRRLAEGTMQRADDVANFGARQGIENILSLTPGFNQSVGAQPRQLLRDRRLTQAEHILNLGHRLFPPMSRQRIKSRPSCAKAFRNPLASCALSIIASRSKWSSREEDEGRGFIEVLLLMLSYFAACRIKHLSAGNAIRLQALQGRGKATPPAR